MAKITWPSVGAANAAYDGNISTLRTMLTQFASWAEKSPAAKPILGTHLSAVLNYFGITPTVPSTQIVVASGVKVLGPAITGSYVNGYTFTIVGGVVTAIVAS